MRTRLIVKAKCRNLYRKPELLGSKRLKVRVFGSFKTFYYSYLLSLLKCVLRSGAAWLECGLDQPPYLYEQCRHKGEQANQKQLIDRKWCDTKGCFKDGKPQDGKEQSGAKGKSCNRVNVTKYAQLENGGFSSAVKAVPKSCKA